MNELVNSFLFLYYFLYIHEEIDDGCGDGRIVVEDITDENGSFEDIYYSLIDNTYSNSHVHKCTYNSFVFYNKFSQTQIKVNIVSHSGGSHNWRDLNCTD